MRHSSKISACRRGLNTHTAAQPRAPTQSRQRARLQAPVESVRKKPALVPRPFTRVLRCIGPLYRLQAAPTFPQESVPRLGPQRAAAGVWCSSPMAAVLWLAPRLCSLRAALPNPSFKPSPNGVPRGPGRRYAVHFRHPGPRVTPLVPA